MDGGGANTDIPVPERIQGEDTSLYAMVLPVILGYLSSQQGHVGDVEEAGLYSQAACVCFSIALVALTASCPLPCSSKAQQICLFHLILGCALLLSLAVPNKLCWAPYFSCIRPIFHLLPRSFQRRILQFFRSVFDAIKRLVGLVSSGVGSLFQMLQSPFGLLIRQSNASGRLVAVGGSRNPPQSSSPVQADFNSQQVVELAEGGRLVAGVAQSSSPARANLNSRQEAVELRLQSSNAIGRLVAVGDGRNPPQSSSPVQADFNSQQVVELAAGGRLVVVGVAQSSAPAGANFNSQPVVEAVELRVQSSNATGRLVAVGASPHAQLSSPAQANFNSQQEEVELRLQEMTSTDASTSGVHKP